MTKGFLAYFICVLLLLELSSSFAWTQEHFPDNIVWGPSERTSSLASYIIPKDGSNFYTVKASKRRLISSTLFINEYKNLKKVRSGKIQTKVNKSFANFEGARYISGSIYIFLSDRGKDENFLYMQRYSEDLVPIGNAVLLGQYQLDRKRYKGDFQIILSKDKSHFAAIWTIPGKKEEKDGYGYKVFTKGMEEVNSGNYTLPFEGEMTSVKRTHLSNSGDYFLAVFEYEEGEKKLLKTAINHKAIHLYHVATDDFREYTIQLNDLRLDQVVLNSNDSGVFVMTGLYGDERSSNNKGLLYFALDYEKNEIIDQDFKPFDVSFITEGWSDSQIEKAEGRQENGKGAPELYNYYMRNIEILPNGEYVGTMEQYYLIESSVSDPRTGSMQTTYTYHYNNIICFKLSVNGEFEWIRKIKKSQVSKDDGGYYSSFLQILDDGKLFLMFNDTWKNYDEEGDYAGTANNSSKKKKRNVVALITVDLDAGDIKRQPYFSRKEMDAVIVPKRSVVDVNNGDVLIFAVGSNRERFGWVKSNLESPD